MQIFNKSKLNLETLTVEQTNGNNLSRDIEQRRQQSPKKTVYTKTAFNIHNIANAPIHENQLN